MQKHKYLLKPDVRKPEDKKFKDFFEAQKLPVSADYRSKMAEIWNQLNLGACQSFAIDRIMAYLHDNPFEPSHLFTYYGVRVIEDTVDEDSGGTLSDTIDAVKKNDIVSSVFWPYIISKFTDKPPQTVYDDASKLDYKISEAYRIDSIDEMKQALAAGHLPYIGITVYENFETPAVMKTGVIPFPMGAVLGGHALVIAAYYDALPLKKGTCLINKLLGKTPSKGYVVIANSWGTGIGLDGSGYFTATYEVLDKLLQDMWIIVK